MTHERITIRSRESYIGHWTAKLFKLKFGLN